MNDHGHVERRTDGTKADCGGPFECESCTEDLIAIHRSEVNPFYWIILRTIDGLGKKVNAMGCEKIVWDASAFSELAARVKDVETMLETWAPIVGSIMVRDKWNSTFHPAAAPQPAGDAQLREHICELAHQVLAREGENEQLRQRIAELQKERDEEYNRAEYALSKAGQTNSVNEHCRAVISTLNARVAELEQANSALRASRDHLLRQVLATAAKLQDELDNAKEN